MLGSVSQRGRNDGHQHVLGLQAWWFESERTEPMLCP